jgi:hypothetical protein
MSSHESSVRETADIATKSAREMAGQVAEQAGPVLDEAQDLIQSGIDSVSQTVRERPLLSIALVGAFAFTIGALSKGRASRERSLVEDLQRYLPRRYR